MPKKKQQEEAKIHFHNGKKAFEIKQSEKAMSELIEALQYYRQTEEYVILAEIYRMLGELYFEKGEQIDSRNSYKRAYFAFENFNNKIGMADSYDKVALSFMIQDELEHAKDYQEKAIAIRKKTPDKKGLARGLKNLAIIVYQLKEDYESAISLLNEAIALMSRIKEPQLTINILRDKYKLHLKNKKFEEAMESLMIARRLGKKFGIKLSEETEIDFGEILLNLGLEYYEKGNKEQALKFLKNAKLALQQRDNEILESVENIISKLEKK